ncbi:MAG: hypothetical protein ABEJ31_12170 [Haloarculaceae archaeon]
MTTNETLPRPITPRRLYVGLWLLAGLAYGVLIAADYPLAGVAAFVLLGLAAVAYRYRAPAALFDERDRTLGRRAAGRTLRVVGVASAVFFPTAVVLWALGYHAWPPWLSYLGVYVAALFALFGFVTLLTRRSG